MAVSSSHIADSPRKGHHHRSLSAAMPVSSSYTNLLSASRRAGSKVCVCVCTCVYVGVGYMCVGVCGSGTDNYIALN